MVRFVAFGRALRPALMVVLGAVIGAGATPTIASALHATAPAVTQSRSLSCQGRNFHPLDDTVTYTMYGNASVQTSFGGTSPVPFVCDVSLPNKALVTKVQFTAIAKSLTSATLDQCGLFRSGLSTTTAATTEPLGVLPTISSNAGLVRRTTTTIAHATVDSGNYAYWLQCVIGPSTSQAHDLVGIYGADVVYSISSANG
jgi:hypothetical protein